MPFKYIAHEREIGISPVLRHFRIEGLGIDRQKFLATLQPIFPSLPLDPHNPTPIERRWAVAQFDVTYQKSGSHIERVPAEPYVQSVHPQPRQFEELERSITQSDPLQALLHATASILEEVRSSAKRAMFFLHAIRVALKHGEKYHHPDGIHQDDADLLIPALVVRRWGVCGAQSRVYADPQGSSIYQATLQPGEGTLLDDRALWHGVSPMSCEEIRGGERDFLGLDAHLQRQE